MEVVEWNKKWSPPFPYCPVSLQYPWKKTLVGKKFFFSVKINFSWFFSFSSLYPVTILLRFIGVKSYTSSFYQLSELRQIACQNCPLFFRSISLSVLTFSVLEYQMDRSSVFLLRTSYFCSYLILGLSLTFWFVGGTFTFNFSFITSFDFSVDLSIFYPFICNIKIYAKSYTK